MTDSLRLDIGAGGVKIPGFVPVDRKNGQEAYPLSYRDESVDEIRASHVLEHFGIAEVMPVLRDWFRALKPGGLLRVAVPNFSTIARDYSAGLSRDMQKLYAMGGQTDENDFHRSAWDDQSLRVALYNAGFHGIRYWESEAEDCASLPVSLNLQGTKPKTILWDSLPKLMAVMSMPKLAFTENLFCALQTFTPRKVNIIKNTGVFWGQCMERTMQDAIDDGAEWIVTLDYDSVFSPDQFDRIVYLMHEHPEADAISPWQVKRENDTPIVWMTHDDGTPRPRAKMIEFEDDLVRVHSAHFGLTIFRAEALLRMQHPWFLAQPSPNNDWGEQRVDEDIHFWNKWRMTGNSLYMACHVCIGHLQQVVTWPTQTLGACHQYISDFQKIGVPANARR